MAITFTIDVARRLVLLRAESFSDQDEWFARFDEAVADPRFEPGFDFLYDRTTGPEIPDTELVRSWVLRHARRINGIGGGRLAVIVSEPAIYGMLRMASVFAESEGVRVGGFWSEAEALAWLSRDSGTSTASTGP